MFISQTHTGDDEELESEDDRRERMKRESLYDDVLSQFQEFEEHKNKQAAESKRKKEEEAALIRAGRPSTAAALGRMAAQMASEHKLNDDEEDEDEDTQAKKRRHLRRMQKSNRKAMTMSLALQPICDVLNENVRANAELAKDEQKRLEKQTRFENKMNAIFAAAAAKTANLPIDPKNILDLVDLTK